jgi:hypothetical protein
MPPIYVFTNAFPFSEILSETAAHSELLAAFDFVHRPVFEELENTTFRRLDLFPSSGEGRDTYSAGSLTKDITTITRQSSSM